MRVISLSGYHNGQSYNRHFYVRRLPLPRVFVYLPPFISQILDFIYRMVLILILIYFEWRDSENQQYKQNPGTKCSLNSL